MIFYIALFCVLLGSTVLLVGQWWTWRKEAKADKADANLRAWLDRQAPLGGNR